MKAIPMPVSRDEKIEVIQRYFYGSHPHYQALSGEDEGKSYPAYHSLHKYPKGVEPDPREIIAEHVDGVRVWASRATSSAGAHFAAIDVDTTDPGVLRELRERLDALYGPRAYNWEQREGSGVHVWFLWDGVIERELGEALVVPIDRDEWMSDVVDVVYPIDNSPLRLPFPDFYYPSPEFLSDQLEILELEDIERLVGSFTTETEAVCGMMKSDQIHVPDNPEGVVPSNTNNNNPCLGQSDGSDTSCSDDFYRRTLKERVDGALSIAPVDGHFHRELIIHNLLSNCIGVYGEPTGMRKLEAWIRRGASESVQRRLEELHAYHHRNQNRGHLPALTQPPLDASDMGYFWHGMFGELLSFIKGSAIRLAVSRCLFAMLVCEYRARELNMSTWWISTRDLAERLGHDRESGRKPIGRYLKYIVTGRQTEQLPAFRIEQEHTAAHAPRYALEADYEFLLEYLPKLPPLKLEVERSNLIVPTENQRR